MNYLIFFPFLQPEIVHKVNSHPHDESEVLACHSIIDSACSSEVHAQSPASKKSVGRIENFWESYMVVCGALFNYCMPVVWNAVFYDSIAERSSSWRKGKLWSGCSKVALPASDSTRCANTSDKPSGRHMSLSDVGLTILLFYFIYLHG